MLASFVRLILGFFNPKLPCKSFFMGDPPTLVYCEKKLPLNYKFSANFFLDFGRFESLIDFFLTERPK
jgi:hypothetical protein